MIWGYPLFLETPIPKYTTTHVSWDPSRDSFPSFTWQSSYWIPLSLQKLKKKGDVYLDDQLDLLVTKILVRPQWGFITSSSSSKKHTTLLLRCNFLSYLHLLISTQLPHPLPSIPLPCVTGGIPPSIITFHLRRPPAAGCKAAALRLGGFRLGGFRCLRPSAGVLVVVVVGSSSFRGGNQKFHPSLCGS